MKQLRLLTGAMAWVWTATAALPAGAQGQAHEQPLLFAPANAPHLEGEITLPSPHATNTPPESWLRQTGDLQVRNIQQATLLPFLPPRHLATGEAVIVAPGGGFLGLAIQDEGYDVARALAARGIAAFVLKYRVLPTPADFGTFMREMIAGRSGKPTTIRPPEDTPDFSLQDARAALVYVRAHGDDWGIDKSRVGMMGFSAGAFLTISAALKLPASERPVFIAPIYPKMVARDVPADAPPMFVAIADDDFLMAPGTLGLIESWHKAHRPVEFHLFQTGHHGFGLGAPGTTTAGWLDSFVRWLDMNRATRRGE
ncbi:alpha/beta hydrolase [Novosphingobium rosa]|uniref:alpha/beta hydrolase n=1 Tax=Novosphingobium rosa TaxID=76978 RepID=UPI000B069A4A|nr:alpha/beta hydrolase [Novosphingobium rosa]